MTTYEPSRADTSRLNLAPGTELGPLELAPISRWTLARFAGASGDHNPVHVDIDAARALGLEDVFAHGMLSMAYLGRLLTSLVPQNRIRSYGVRFTAITPVHGRPSCHGRVERVHNGTAQLDLTVTLPDGTVTLSGYAEIDIADNGD